jgi:hypothetical protein
MRFYDSLAVLLLVLGIVIMFVHRLRVRRERLRPTFHHSLFASHMSSALNRPVRRRLQRQLG